MSPGHLVNPVQSGQGDLGTSLSSPAHPSPSPCYFQATFGSTQLPLTAAAPHSGAVGGHQRVCSSSKNMQPPLGAFGVLGASPVEESQWINYKLKDLVTLTA